MLYRYRFLLAVVLSGVWSGATAQTDFWRRSNGPIGATVPEVEVHPTDGTILVVVSGGGVFRSTDGGTTWSPSNTGLQSERVSALAVHPSGDFFAGTGNGIFRSVNSGVSWTRVYSSTSLIQSLAVDASNGDVFVSSLFASNGTLIRSRDNGATWEEFTSGLQGTSFIPGLAVDTLSGTVFMATASAGILRSTDRGETWHSVNQGIPTLRVNAVGVAADGTVFVGTGPDTSSRVFDRYIYRSTDGGESWARVHTSRFDTQAFSFNASGDIFASTAGGVLRSTNGGTVWQEMNSGLQSRYVLDIAFDADGQTFAATHCSGIYRSTDNGATWLATNGDLNYITIQSLFVRPENGHVYVGTHCGGVYRSADDGASWHWLGLLGGINDIAVNRSGQIFVGTSTIDLFGGAGGYILRSNNDGASWQNVSPDNDFFLSLEFDPDGNLYAGTGYFQLCGLSFCDYGDIYRSTNDGASWTRVAKKLDDHVFDLEAHPQGRIFAATREGVYRSFGEFWHKILKGDARSLLADPNTGDVFAGTNSGIYRTSDQGETWTRLTTLSGSQTWALAVTDDGELYAGTKDEGILLSDDNGATWRFVNSGLTTRDVRSLAVNRTTGTVFAGTLGHGLFIHAGTPTSVAESPQTVPAGFALHQNYPNPFNPSTTIAYTLPQPAHVRLHIYNVTGQRVRTLVDEQKLAGQHKVVWDGRSDAGQRMPSGVYLYRIEAGDFRAVRRLAMVK